MVVILALLVGGLYAAGIYLILRRSVVKLLLGLALLGHGANLLIFTAGGLTRTHAPLIAEGASRPPAIYADPLPQALVLTAIVIGLAVLAFALSLLNKVHEVVETDDLDALRATDT